MDWRVCLDFDTVHAGRLAVGDGLRLERRARFRARASGLLAGRALLPLLERVSAVYPHCVGVDAETVLDRSAALQQWLAERRSGAFAVCAYADGDAVSRRLFCFRRPDDAGRFGARFG